jgi:hypothetical protein
MHLDVAGAAAATMMGLTAAALCLADLLNPQWSPVEEMVSHYVHGRAGWLTVTALICAAIGSAVLTDLVRQILPGATLGRALLGVWTAAVAVGAAFPADPPGQWDRPPSAAGMIHGLAALAAFMALPVAVVLLTRAVNTLPDAPLNPVLRGLATACLASTAVFLIAAIEVLDGPSIAAFGYTKLVGLLERVTLGVDLAWLTALAIRLRSVPLPADATIVR